MNRIEFERSLSDYVRGELPKAVAQEFDDYLAAHPEAAAEVEAARTILEQSAGISASEPPAQLLAAARASTLNAIRSDHEQPRRSGSWLALPGPAWMTGLVVVLASLFLGVLWRGSSTPVWAQVVQEVRNVSSLRTVGWFRGESGQRVPMKHWFKAPHNFRAEVGAGPDQQVVFSDDKSVYMKIEGVWYRKNHTSPEASFMDEFSKHLLLPERELLEELSYQIDREERGQTVLFSIWRRSSLGRKTPSDIRFEIEADVLTRRPRSARVYLDVGQQEWELVNELHYLDYEAAVADELFEFADDDALPAPDNLLKANAMVGAFAPIGPWYGLAFYMPREGMDIVVLTPSTDPTKGKEGISSTRSGGIVRYEFHSMPLMEIAQTLGGRPVEIPDSVLSERRFSARIAHRNTIDPVERVRRLGERLDFVTELRARHGTRTHWILTQDGTDFPVSSARNVSIGTSGYNIDGAGVTLATGIQNMLSSAAGGDLVKGYNKLLDEVEMKWEGAASSNPFHRRVDISVDFSDGWEVALKYLRDNFGVTMERVSEPITYEVLVLSPHKEVG